MRRCSMPASFRVAAACISRAVAGVATHSVLRIAWWRTSVRSSYSARSMASNEGLAIRTRAER